MELSALRDLVIVIFGLLGIIATLLVLVLIIIAYRKVVPIINSVRKTAETVRDTSSLISEQIVQPIARVQGFVSGVRKAAEVMGKFRRKEGEKGGK